MVDNFHLWAYLSFAYLLGFASPLVVVWIMVRSEFHLPLENRHNFDAWAAREKRVRGWLGRALQQWATRMTNWLYRMGF